MGTVTVTFMPLIGLYGEMESGKDSVADILVNDFEYTRLAVGDHIREEVSLGCLPNGMWCPDTIRHTLLSMKEKRMKEALYAKPTTPEIRALLQWYGEARFHVQPDYWLKMLARDVAKVRSHRKHKIVISDVRRVNEYGYCCNHGEMWKVIRCSGLDELLLRDRKEKKYGALHDHITETALGNYPFKQYISNNGDLGDLRRLVNMLVIEYSLV